MPQDRVDNGDEANTSQETKHSEIARNTTFHQPDRDRSADRRRAARYPSNTGRYRPKQCAEQLAFPFEVQRNSLGRKDSEQPERPVETNNGHPCRAPRSYRPHRG
ncbi:hypothetical protein GCM10023318_04200 [Nocardia callitridis]|uniref:Uncharacterized protein n=1 Tax=Nocardia callitridis TaxID=648753 RepID=A0ABP9JS51_9NOCA